MRLLIGSSSPPDKGSGINAYVRELCEALINLGHDVRLSSPRPNDVSWLEQHGIEHVVTDQFEEPEECTRRLINYVRDQDIQGVINNDNALIQNIAPAVSCSFLAVGHMGRTSVASLACFQHEWTDHVVAISSDMQSIYVRRLGVPIIKCPIVYNGVADPGRPVDYTAGKDGNLAVVFAGGYNRNKGCREIERSLVRFKEAWQGIKLHWFGHVPERVVCRLARHGCIEFHGRVGRERFLETLSKADVLLLPSLTEGCPMTMLEAMSLGVVPVASDGLGAMRWLVTSGQDGFICHLDDWPSQQMQCLAYFLRHPEGLLQMKQASYLRFRQNFQSTATARHLVDLLNRPTVDRNRPSRAIQLLRWHRPFRPDGLKSPLIDRLAIRAGWLRKAGILKLSDAPL